LKSGRNGNIRRIALRNRGRTGRRRVGDRYRGDAENSNGDETGRSCQREEKSAQNASSSNCVPSG
jgi:hypothetical protein